MMWDYPEVNIFTDSSGGALGSLEYLTAAIRQEGGYRLPTQCIRGSATELTFDEAFFDAVITDPPYYDNESYAELSDFFYVWLRPAVGFLYPEHFAGKLTPKKKECVAAAYRQGGKTAAKKFYEVLSVPITPAGPSRHEARRPPHHDLRSQDHARMEHAR